MAVILRPGKFKSQPQYRAPLVNPGFWRLIDIQSLPPVGIAPVTRTLNVTTKLDTGIGGKCVNFVALGDYLDYGSDPNLQLSTMTGIAIVEMPASMGTRSVIFNTNTGGISSGGFMIHILTDGTVMAAKLDVAIIGATTQAVKLGTGLSVVAWSYNSTTGLIRIAVDGVLATTTAAQTLTHGVVSRNQYYLGATTYANPYKQYFFALSASDAVSDGQLISWTASPSAPYSIFQAPPRRLWAVSGGGATAYFQSISGSLTPAGALTKQTSKQLAGSSTGAGALAKKTSRSLVGSSTPSGNLIKQTAHSFAGSITPSGTLATMILFTCAVVGSLTASGALKKMTLKALTGSSTLSGAITKLTSKGLSASITMSGLLSKLTKKAFAGSTTVTGSLTESYQVLKSLAGSITPTGAVTALYIAFVAGVLKLLALMGVGQ